MFFKYPCAEHLFIYRFRLFVRQYHAILFLYFFRYISPYFVKNQPLLFNRNGSPAFIRFCPARPHGDHPAHCRPFVIIERVFPLCQVLLFFTFFLCIFNKIPQFSHPNVPISFYKRKYRFIFFSKERPAVFLRQIIQCRSPLQR